MSNVFSSPGDELGNNKQSRNVRRLSDFTTDNGTYLVLDRNTGVIERLTQLVSTKPVLITAGDSLRTRNKVNLNTPWIYAGAEDTAMFTSLPLKRGIIQNFADDGGGNLRVNSTGHTLNVNDFVKITDSRTSTYNGNHLITAAGAGTFDISSVAFVDADGQSEWLQGKVFFTGTSAGTGTEIVLAAVAHPFAADDWINIYDATGSPDINTTTQIVSTTANTITIDIGSAFVSTTTGNMDTGIGTLDVDHDPLVNFPNGVRRQLISLSGSFSPSVRSLLIFLRMLIASFDIGETKDFFSLVVADTALLVESNNWRTMDDAIIDFRDTGVEVLGTPTTTQDFQSLFVFGGAGDTNAVINNYLLDLVTDTAGFTIPPNLGNNTLINITNTRTTPNPLYFSTGHIARAEGDIASANAGSKITIPITDTSPFRVSDSVALIESTSYDTTPANLSSLVIDTSITLDKAFIATDTDVLIKNQTVNSIGITDPRLTSTENQDLKNSMAAGEVDLDTPLTVPLTQNVFAPINGGNWVAGFLERFSVDVGGDGILTVTALETADYVINFSCILSSNTGAAKDFELTVLVNGSSTVIPLPAKLNISGSPTQLAGSAIIELVTGDTLQMAIQNTTDSVDVDVDQAEITVLRGG